MKSFKTVSMVLALVFFIAPAAWSAENLLFEWATNVDNVIDYYNPESVGLETVTIDVSGVGAHSVLGYFDYEIDRGLNTYYNEYGATAGLLATGQSWEIDEPEYGNPETGYFGDIYYTGFSNNALQNQIMDGTFSGPEDISMAMGWNFNLIANPTMYQTAKVTFTASETAPTSGFYLIQHDPQSNASIYLYSDLEITDHSVGVPEPASLLLLGLGLGGMALTRKIRRREF